MPAPARPWSSLLAGLLAGGLGCDWPRDPEATLNHVRGGVLRVGAVHEPPWVSVDPGGGPPRGLEVELTEDLARQLGAELRWQYGGETRLMRSLKHFELDLVIGGITSDSPYRSEVGFTRPYRTGPGGAHVFAAPPGENGWISTLDGFLGEASRPQEPAP